MVLERPLYDTNARRRTDDDNNHLGELRSFLATFAHEMRGPLHVVAAHAEFLKLAGPGAEGIESCQAIGDAVRHIRALVDDVASFTDRKSFGEPRLCEVKLHLLLSRTVRALKPAAKARNVVVTLEDFSLSVRADERRLSQVLLNIVSNAIKYNREHGWVRIRCVERAGGRVRVEVTDSGVGVPVESAHQVFKPFVRLRKDVPGTGLGLAVSKDLIEAMDGQIGLYPRAQGGTTVWFDLPRFAAAGSQNAETLNSSDAA